MMPRPLFDFLVGSLCADLSASRLNMPRFDEEKRPEEIWRQKVFCVLSSQCHAQSASHFADQIVRLIPFFDQSLSVRKIEESCFKLLTGDKIGYRFPNVRARQISLCWFPFSQIKNEYQEYVRSFRSEQEARRQIVDKFPGIGLKQASMFLRNIGASKTLSVIDVHVLFYLRVCHGWDADNLTPKRYLVAEDILREDASRYGLDLNVFDVVIWSAAKAMKRANIHV